MKIDTVKGCAYVVTCTGACTVQVLRPDASPITILDIESPGQYSFVAPTDTVEVSDEHALVTQTFKAAVPGLSARGGIHPGDDMEIRNLTAEAATFSGTVNANGGIHIPLAAGAAMDTAAVNRAYALGMAQLVQMHQSRTYWLTDSCTATNGVILNHVVPGCYCTARIGDNSAASITMQTTGAVGGSNYGKILGYSIPFRHDSGGPGAWCKLSMIIGAGGQWTEYPDGGMDDFRFRPVVGSVPSIARLVEVTFYYDNGHRVRVRELIGNGNPRSYVVRITESKLEYDDNSSPSSAGYRLIIAQTELSYTDDLAASVWLIMGGASDDTVIKLADIRGWDTYHLSSAPVLYMDAHAPSYGCVLRMEAPTVLNGIGNNTYIRHGLEPYERRWIISEEEVPYIEPEQ